MTIDTATLLANLNNPTWRLNNLYKIIIKGETEDDDLVIQFRMNRAQLRFLSRMWHRNIILKARQLGFTTLIAILWLDTALFSKSPIRCGMIAQDKEAAEVIFRDKVKFAYESLPPELRVRMPLAKDSASELLFAHNGSSFRVATSMRSGTIHRLHISEFGKICAQYPDKAKEVVTGSIPAVPTSGILIIESTAEGREGDFYDMVQRSIKVQQGGKELTQRDYKFHFFPWYDEPGYEMDPANVLMTPQDHEYFDKVEVLAGVKISMAKRAWYVATRDADFVGRDELMWQEYPSTSEESFQKSTEGCYYTAQLVSARKNQRIKSLPLLLNLPCNTFWDIGSTDGTAIWVHQQVGHENRFVRFYEAWGEPYSHAVAWLQTLGVVFDTHYLPHDAEHERQGATSNESPEQMLAKLMPGAKFEIVERIDNVNWGIQQTRDLFPTFYFDEEHCQKGLIHIESYRKKRNERLNCWSDEPSKEGGHSEAADALRQCGQGYKGPRPAGKKISRRGSAMAV